MKQNPYFLFVAFILLVTGGLITGIGVSDFKIANLAYLLIFGSLFISGGIFWTLLHVRWVRNEHMVTVGYWPCTIDGKSDMIRIISNGQRWFGINKAGLSRSLDWWEQVGQLEWVALDLPPSRHRAKMS